MICEPCASAADGADLGPADPVCSACGLLPVALYGNGTVRFHKFRPPTSVTKVKCPGTGEPPRLLRTGHDFCNGCSCQHKPPGSWKGDQS